MPVTCRVLLLSAMPLALIMLLALWSARLQAEVELTPFTGFRATSGITIRSGAAESRDRVELHDTMSQGLLLNVDLEEPGKQLEFYLGRQQTTATTSEALFLPATTRVELVVYQLQFGGLYFPGGRTHGGFVSGVAGLTRLDPSPGELKSHDRAALSLGGGYKIRLGDKLRIRVELRGIYTALDSRGAIFCSGGCTARFDSDGYLQVEAAAGLAFRF